MSDETTWLSDTLLVAMPGMEDSRFKNSVVYLFTHDAEGAMGIIINKPLGHVGISDLLEQLNVETEKPLLDEIDVYFGGPVEPERGFILHNAKHHYQNTLKVSEQLAVTGTTEIIKAIAHDEGPDDILFALGYSGWSAGQLEDEITNNAWLHVPATPDLIFDIPNDQKWALAMERIGVNPALLSTASGKA